MENTLHIKRPLVKIAPGHNIRIDNNMETTFHKDLRGETIMRRVETGRFEVRFTAKTCAHLHLDWLHTKAFIRDGGGLVILESSRYSQPCIEDYGDEQVIEWINQDREEMAKIIRSYVGISNEVRIFDARVEVVHKASGAVLGAAALGGCIYDSYEEFCRGGGYASDLVAEAVSEARDAIHDLLAPPSTAR